VGKYQSYPEYIDSKIDWVGQVPKHWELVPLRAVLNFRNEKNDPQKTDNVLSLSIAHGVTEYSEENRVGGNKKKDDLTSYKLAYPNDIVMNSMNIIVGAVGISKYFGAISPVYYALYADSHSVCLSYYASIFDNSGFQKGLLRFGKGILIKISDNGKLNTIRMKVSQDDLKVMYFPKPPYEEQQKIANFLDHETAKIDTLIEKQQQLIKLLKGKRQAVISHAVTKGLNPNAPMRDSGVEWLGEVPEHWTLGRLKNVLRIRNGKDYKDVEVQEGGYPVYGSGGIFKRSSGYLYDGKSVLFGRKGTIDKPLVVEGKFWTVDTMFYSEVFDNALPEYIHFQSTNFPFNLLSTNTALPSMTQEDLLELAFLIPPIEEQVNIISIAQEKSEEYENLIAKAESAIELMQERRTALISAAVTGKIDVRNWQEPEDKQSKVNAL